MAAKKESLVAKKFIIELNEEVDDAVDRASEAMERGKFPKAKKILDPLIREHPIVLLVRKKYRSVNLVWSQLF